MLKLIAKNIFSNVIVISLTIIILIIPFIPNLLISSQKDNIGIYITAESDFTKNYFNDFFSEKYEVIVFESLNVLEDNIYNDDFDIILSIDESNQNNTNITYYTSKNPEILLPFKVEINYFLNLNNNYSNNIKQIINDTNPQLKNVIKDTVLIKLKLISFSGNVKYPVFWSSC